MKWIKIFIFSFCIFTCINSAYSGVLEGDQLMDPMIPITEDNQVSEVKIDSKKLNLYLSMIGASSDGELYAVINGKILMIGDNIDQYSIFNIKKHKVVLTNKDDNKLDLNFTK